MTVYCIAFVGKNNEPIFVSSNVEEAEALQLQYIAHSALDVIDEKRGKKTAGNATLDMYLGQLYPTEDYRVFGYFTNTLTKIVAICDAGTAEADLREFFQSLHSMFVAEIQNPFQAIGEPISSSQFQNKVQRAINTFHAIDSRSAGQHL